MHVMHVTHKGIKIIKMKILSIIYFILLISNGLQGQSDQYILEARVTFKSSRNIYVKFNSTDNINPGDTLYSWYSDKWIPSLRVIQKSSTSCVCKNFTGQDVNIGDRIAFISTITPLVNEIKEEVIIPTIIFPAVTHDTIKTDTIKKINKKQTLNGRLSVSTNASLNPATNNNFNRIRTAFSMNIQNIQNSSFSAQTYLTYRHRYGIDQSTSGFYDDFKVFTLALQYSSSENYNISIGRKLNNNIANMGAIDGLQAEYKLNNYIVGFFGGTRPDFKDFSFNASLPQFGAYVVRNDKSSLGTAQTSLAFAEQENNFKTDRRFLYFQHNNSLFKNVNLFLSSELDLFKKVNEITTNNLSITSLYFSLRYKIRQNFNLSASYDNRRNIILVQPPKIRTKLQTIIKNKTSVLSLRWQG